MGADGRLRWRCRRGMRELDRLLLGYLDTRYSGASAAEQAEFAALLELQDPVLWRYLTGRDEPPEAAQRALIAQILARSCSGST